MFGGFGLVQSGDDVLSDENLFSYLFYDLVGPGTGTEVNM